MSTTAWEVLDIAETEDVRSIKRAYAKALKQCRPEEDPAAFQTLTSAFEWALGYAHHCARTRAQEQEQEQEEIAAEQGSVAEPACEPMQSGVDPVPAEEAAALVADAGDDSEGRFDFNPFFEGLGEQIQKPNPLHLKEWLEAHPALYSIELKWALIPHVFDALARNAAVLDPHRGHLETLQAFFGVDATLRSHSAVAPAIDYLESKAWKQPEPVPAQPMPAGWENLHEVMDERRSVGGYKRKRPSSNDRAVPVWAIIFGIWIVLKIAVALGSAH